MADKRISIYVGPDLQRVLDERSRPGEQGERSHLINLLADRYSDLMWRSRPELSTAEWKLVCDALNGCLMEPAGHAGALTLEISDAIRLNGLAEKWSVDGKALVKKLAALTPAQRLSVIDVAERFWVGDLTRDADEMLAEILGRTPPAE